MLSRRVAILISILLGVAVAVGACGAAAAGGGAITIAQTARLHEEVSGG